MNNTGLDKNEIESKINRLVELSTISGKIDKRLYAEYDVKQGLRDSAGKGVLTGLTEISDVIGSATGDKGQRISAEGQLYYQGLNIYDIKRFSFEKEYELELESYVAKNVVLLSCTLLFSKKSFISLFLTISKVPGVPILKGVLL